MKKVNFFNEIVFSIIIEPLSSISKMLRFVFIFSLFVLSSPSYVLSMFVETSAEPNLYNVYLHQINGVKFTAREIDIFACIND